MKTACILIVEDEFIVAQDTRLVLEQLGYCVSAIAVSGEDAVRMAADSKPDLVLMDVKLKQDVDGIDAAQQLQEQFGLPIIYLTSYTGDDELERAMVTHPFAYLIKPVNKKELRVAVESALHHHKVENDLQAAQHSLEEQRAFLKQVIEINPNPIFVRDRQGIFVLVNSAAAKLMGKPADELIGKSAGDHYHNQEQARIFHQEDLQVMDTLQEIHQPEVKTIFPDSTEHWVEIVKRPLLNANGKADQVLVSMVDLVEQKRIDSTLKLQSEISTNMAEGVILVRIADLMILYTNPRFEEIFGYQPGEMLGQQAAIVNAPTEKSPLETAKDIKKQLLEDGYWRGEVLNIKKDGTPFWCQANVTAFEHYEYGQVLVSVHTDITAYKEAENALQQKNLALEKRVRELKCLHGLSKLVDTPDNTLDDIFKGLLEIIPSAWQSPHLIGVQIALEDRIFATPNFSLTAPSLQSKIITRGRQIGTITVCSLSEGEFDSYLGETEYLLNIISERLGRFIEHERLDNEIRERNRELEGFTQISTALRNAQSQKEIIKVVSEEVLQILDANIGVIFIQPHDEPDTITYRNAITGLSPADIKQFYKISKQTTELQGLPMLHLNLPQPVLHNCAVTIMPLYKADESIGTFFIIWQQSMEFTQQEKNLLKAIANIVSEALARAGMMETLEEKIRSRTLELAALYQVSTISANAVLDLNESLQQFLKVFISISAGQSAAIRFLDEEKKNLVMIAQHNIDPEISLAMQSIPLEESIVQRVIEYNEPLIINHADTRDDMPAWMQKIGLKTLINIPIKTHKQLYGVISIGIHTDKSISVEKINLLITMTDQIGNVIERQYLYQELEQSAVIKERQRLARNLHDDITQTLYSLNLLTEVTQKLAQANKWDRTRQHLKTLGDTTLQVLKEMRMLVYELRPHLAGEKSLEAMLRQRLDAVEQRSGIDTRLEITGDYQLSQTVQDELFYIAQEALNNSLKHAAASTVTVQLDCNASQIVLQVSDDGKGFDLNNPDGGFGLVGMRERAKNIGGELEVETAPGQGTRVRVMIEGEAC